MFIRRVFLVMLVVAMAHGAGAVEELPAHFDPLFNGKDLTGWVGDDRLWSVKDGTIVGTTDGNKIQQNSFLSTTRRYSDFVLRAEVKLRNGNSGIQFRAEQLPNHATAGYQADIAEQTYFGMLYEERKRGFMPYWQAMTPAERAKTQEWVKKDDWNELEVTCLGDYIKIRLNGHTTCEIRDPEGARSGIIALQLHTGPDMQVAYRNIGIMEYKPDPMTSPPDESALLMPDVEERRERFSFNDERFRTPEGFVVEQVASPDLVGSVINLAFDPMGRPTVASEPNGMRILLDENGDGVYDAQKIYSDDVQTAMGIHWIGAGDLMVHSKGPHDAALYRLRDIDGDDRADELSMIMKSWGGIGEHGPHTILTGPDGYLYVLYGNHAGPADPESASSPLRNTQEDHLLERYVDPRGHANNIMAPGGTVHRIDPETGEWSQLFGGFRNPFDMAMNLEGEIFLFDSDMEWDFGLPWFRPVRVVHGIPGADYGWRTGSSKKPFYYIDTLPSVDDVGRGSPVGVVFYYHDVYPEQYRGAYFMGDWSRGRIRVVFPKQQGATYVGKTVDFVVGEPLNVTDLDVGPDGHLYFTTGGRGTTGGLYRVRYTGKQAPRPDLSGVEAVVKQPMPRSAWGEANIRAIQAKTSPRVWADELQNIVADAKRSTEDRLRALEALQIYGPQPSRSRLEGLLADPDAKVRAQAVFLLGTFPLELVRAPLTEAVQDHDPFVARRACEALVRAGLDANSVILPSKDLRQRLVMLLDDEDRYTRYAARVALERCYRAEWPKAVLADSIEKRPRGALEGLLALVNTAQTPSDSNSIFDQLQKYSAAEMDVETTLDYLRVVSLAFIRDKAPATANDDPRAAFKMAVGKRLLDQFPSDDWRVNKELQVVLAYMQTPGAQEKMLAYLTTDKPQEEQIHTVYCLRAMKDGWTKEQREKLVAWFDLGREIGGAASMQGYIDNLWQASLAILPEDERKAAVAQREAADRAKQERALALLADMEGAQAKGGLSQMSFDELADYLEYDPMAYREPNYGRGEQVFRKAKCADCHVYGSIGIGGGPDLSTVTSRFRRREILESIMFPSRVISDQYSAVDLELDDLTTVTGMVAAENDSTLTIITVHGEKVEVPKGKIESRTPSQVSMMPDGLLDTMDMGDLVELMHFLERGAEF